MLEKVEKEDYERTYKGMERGVDIIEDEISTRGAIESLVMQ